MATVAARYWTWTGLLVIALTVASAALAQTAQRYGDELYRPNLRQPGKDVMWLPTPDGMVTRMLHAAKVTSGDLVVDLGAGEGRIPIAAAKEFGATAIGIEYDPALAALARRNATRAGVGDKVTIIAGDMFKQDFSKATVVTMYLLPDLNFQLRPRLLAMKPGTRVVSHMWDMGEWEADETFDLDDSEGFMWIVPARVAGKWSLRDDRGHWQAEVTITQQFQRIGGTMHLYGKTQPILGAFISGSTMGFTFVDIHGGVRSLRAHVDGATLAGQLRYAGNLTPLTGARLP